MEMSYIAIGLIILGLFIWIFAPVAYLLYTNITISLGQLVPVEERQNYELISDIWLNIIRSIGLIVMAAGFYYMWTIAQRKKAEDII